VSIRPTDKGNPPNPPALVEWPEPPQAFGADEREWWVRLGAAAMALGTVSVADLPMAQRAVQVSVRVDGALMDPDFKPTALNAILRLELDYWKQIGLSPQARRGTTPLPKEDSEGSGFEDVE
jgi:hypothetical protein